MSATYNVLVTREGRWWVAQVEGVSGGATETAKLPDLHEEVVDLLTGLLDLDEAEADALEFNWRYDFDEVGVETAVTGFLEAKQAAQEAQEKAEQQLAAAVDQLTHVQGLTVRDTAEVLGYSPARVQQIKRSSPAKVKLAVTRNGSTGRSTVRTEMTGRAGPEKSSPKGKQRI